MVAGVPRSCLLREGCDSTKGHLSGDPGWGDVGRFVWNAKVGEDLADSVRAQDRSDDLHFATALEAVSGIDVENLS